MRWIGDYFIIKENIYNYSYNDNNRMVSRIKSIAKNIFWEVFQFSDSIPFVYKDTTSIYSLNGGILEQDTSVFKVTDYDDIFQEIDSRYNMPSSIDYSNVIGGGGHIDYEYVYGDEDFPTKPTQIIEKFDDNGDGFYDTVDRTTTMKYDTKGNLTEKRVYVDSDEFVLTQMAYHPDYNFPIRQTSYQGYCKEVSGQIETNGAKTEELWVYGKADGTIDGSISKNNKYLIEQKKLLDDNGTSTETDDILAVTSYEYLSNGRMKLKEDQEGKLTYIQYDQNDNFPEKVWEGATLSGGNPQGNPQKRFLHNSFGVPVLNADYLGKVVKTEYDYLLRKTKDIHYEDGDAVTTSFFTLDRYDVNGTISSEQKVFIYDGYTFHNVLHREFVPSGARKEYLTYYSKNLGLLDYGEGPISVDSQIIYNDANGNIIYREINVSDHYNSSIHTSLINEKYNYYDSLGRKCEEIIIESPDTHDEAHDESESGQEMRRVKYTYYANGKVCNESIFKEFWSGTVGNNQESSYVEKEIYYEYDMLDRVILMKQYVGHGDPNTFTEYGYDALGNKLFTIDPSSNVLFVDYDNASRKIKEYFAVEPVYESGTGIIDIAETKILAKQKVKYEYYNDNKVKSVTSYDSNGSTVLEKTEYEYDSRGRTKKVTQAIDGSNNAVTEYEYYDVRHEIAGSEPNGFNICINDAEDKQTWISLTSQGKLLSIYYPSNDNGTGYEHYRYNCFGKVRQKIIWDGANERTITYDYNDYGNAIKVTYPDNGYIEMEYTTPVYEGGRIVKITDYRTAGDSPYGNGSVWEFNYAPFYDQMVYSKDPDGYEVEYYYNLAYNRKNAVKVYKEVVDGDDILMYDILYDYDLAGKLRSVTDTLLNDDPDDDRVIACFDYTLNGSRQELAYPMHDVIGDPNYYVNYTYNDDNMLTGIYTTSPIRDYDYILAAGDSGDIDGLGRLQQADEMLRYPNSSTISRTYEFDYDMLSQLTRSNITNVGTYNCWTDQYTYDDAGNVQSWTKTTQEGVQTPVVETTNFTYTNSGDSDIMASATGDNPFGLTNDLNGNITKLPTINPTDTVEFNWDNKLRSATKSGTTLNVKYDPLGNRVWRQVDTGTTVTTKKYILDIAGGLPVILCVLDDTGSLETSYVHTPHTAQVLSKREHNTSEPLLIDHHRLYVHDRLGSVRLMLDDDGSIQNAYTYDAYGTPLEAYENLENRMLFTGQWYDSEIEQYYLRARMYDPKMMRFTGRDPVRGTFKEPLTLHKYLYCINDSVNKVDLSGALWGSAWWGEYEFWSEIGSEIVKGAAAGIDGFNPIPFWNPLEYVYANPDGSVDSIYKKSRLAGSVSRLAVSWAINAWAVNSMLKASNVTCTIGERLIIGAFWKGQVVSNTSKSFGMTWAAGSALLSGLSSADNVFDIMDAF